MQNDNDNLLSTLLSITVGVITWILSDDGQAIRDIILWILSATSFLVAIVVNIPKIEDAISYLRRKFKRG